MNNFTIRKKLVLFSFILISLVWSGVALASSYSMSFSFAHQLKSLTRYFSGQNIAFESTPKTLPDPKYPDAKPVESFYEVTLYRDRGWPSIDKIGKAVLPRDSFGKAIWTNVGPGNYYLFFEKYKDRMLVTDEDAKLYNY